VAVAITANNLLRINWELLPVVVVVDCVSTVVLIVSRVDRVMLTSAEEDVLSEELGESVVVATSSSHTLVSEDCCSQMKFQAVLQGY